MIDECLGFQRPWADTVPTHVGGHSSEAFKIVRLYTSQVLTSSESHLSCIKCSDSSDNQGIGIYYLGSLGEIALLIAYYAG